MNIEEHFQTCTPPPKKLFFEGDLSLLNSRKIAIVGTRKPNQYAKSLCAELSSLLVANNFVVVSGGALGIDIIAHQNALPKTIMLSPAPLGVDYPPSNGKIIQEIRKNALLITEYEENYEIQKYSFIERNRLVIGLCEAVIIIQADKNSGSMQSAKIAQKYKKPIFVPPHRLGESEGTNLLLEQNLATLITSPKKLLQDLGCEYESEKIDDEVLLFCAKNPSYEDVVHKFGSKIFEYELLGKIEQNNGKVVVLR